MSPFEPITLEWQGQTHVIPANRVMGAIACIEESVTFLELGLMSETGRPQVSRYAMAYAALLRYAGILVDDATVFRAMLDNATAKPIGEALGAALRMILPPGALVQQDTAPGNAPSAAAPMSKRPTRQRSGRNGSRRRNSGRFTPPNSGGWSRPTAR